MRGHSTTRAAIVFALAYLLCWGSLPAPALAAMAEEARVSAVEVGAREDDAAPDGAAPIEGSSEAAVGIEGESVSEDVVPEDAISTIEEGEADEADALTASEAKGEVPVVEDASVVAGDADSAVTAMEEQGEALVESVAEEDEGGQEPTLATQSASVSNPRVVADSSMQSGQVATWDCVWLGSYPQTEVTASNPAYASLTNATFDSKGDATVGGRRYGRISKSDATFSGYWSDDGYGSAIYRYFRYEPVKWRVLEVNGSSALVVADVVLDDQRYNTNYTIVTWETSSVRSWLNGYGSGSNQPGTDYASRNFFDAAFGSAQKAAILQSTVTNADSQYGTDGGSDTSDRVFLLAESDVWGPASTRHGFAGDYSTYDEARRCGTSDYANAMGATRPTW